jgi:hypothetical protein
LKLNCDVLLSTFAFRFTLRRYTAALAERLALPALYRGMAGP